MDKKVIRDLSNGSFVDRGENIVLLVQPGVGKTHLAVSFGIKAIENGHKILFITQETLPTRLLKALEKNRIERQLQQFVCPKILIID